MTQNSNYPKIKFAIPPDSAILSAVPEPSQESISIPLYESCAPSEAPLKPAENCTSISELFTAHTIVMHPARYPMWRLTELHTATIKGQPYLGECTLVATDGVHGFVITPAKPFLFRIHITNFEGKVEPRGAAAQRSTYSKKGEGKKRITRAERMSAKVTELFEELGI